MKRACLLVCAVTLAGACRSSEPASVLAFTGATILDGVFPPTPIAGQVLVVRDGRIDAIAARVPDGATVVDLSDRFIIPGLINAHGHVGGTRGLERDHYQTENLVRQLRLYARYGVTSVVSLGGDGPEGVALRDEQNTPQLDRARLFVAGTVVAGDTQAAAEAVVDDNVNLGVDFIKIRVDDNLGTITKMPADVYGAVIRRAAEHGKRVASHLYYLDDAKELLRRGTGFIAHSIRDRDVDAELLDLIRTNHICYSPTLTREVSTFVYESEPDFFTDPFFLDAVDPAVLDQLRDPERQASVRENAAAQSYKAALAVAMRNLKTLSDAGVPIAFGTDTGPPARFQGFFEHLELEMMQEAGMSPSAVLRAATSSAAACLGLDGVGILSAGNWADFVVLEEDPLTDIRHLRSIESVWIAGNRVER